MAAKSKIDVSSYEPVLTQIEWYILRQEGLKEEIQEFGSPMKKSGDAILLNSIERECEFLAKESQRLVSALIRVGVPGHIVRQAVMNAGENGREEMGAVETDYNEVIHDGDASIENVLDEADLAKIHDEIQDDSSHLIADDLPINDIPENEEDSFSEEITNRDSLSEDLLSPVSVIDVEDTDAVDTPASVEIGSVSHFDELIRQAEEDAAVTDVASDENVVDATNDESESVETPVDENPPGLFAGENEKLRLIRTEIFGPDETDEEIVEKAMAKLPAPIFASSVINDKN